MSTLPRWKKVRKSKHVTEECYWRGEHCWYASTLRKTVKDAGLKPFSFPVALFDVSKLHFSIDSTTDFIGNMKKTLEADYKKPIILDDHGMVADGIHSLCRAILEGKPTIMAYRLLAMPESDITKNG